MVDLGLSRSRTRSRSRSRHRRDDYDSDISSFRSTSSDDSSVGYVRRKLRKDRVKRTKRMEKKENESDFSDSEAETVDEDVIAIKLELKRGDDVVQSLLNLWTPQLEVKGKGKDT
jgi:hypothetical protein